MRKIIGILLLFSLFSLSFSAGSGSDGELIQQSLCEVQNTMKSFIGTVVFIMILLSLPIILVGAYLYLKKPKWKVVGLFLIAGIVIFDVVLVVVYLFIPMIVNVLVGMDVSSAC